jgi:hypothetical protein
VEAATRADIALAIAIASASISLTSLAWQLVLYRLSGARLIVRLLPAVITEAGHIMRGPPTGWRRSMPTAMNIVGERPWVDVAILEFVNVGRTPISLLDVSLDIGANPRWKPWQRHIVGMRPIAVHNALANLDEVRLEEGRSVFAIFDWSPAVEAGRRVRKRVHVRASARPPGRRRKRGPWHRWKIKSDQKYVWPHGPEDERVQLFQAVWREVAPIDPKAVYEAWIAVIRLLLEEDRDPKTLSIQEVAGALEPIRCRR